MNSNIRLLLCVLLVVGSEFRSSLVAGEQDEGNVEQENKSEDEFELVSTDLGDIKGFKDVSSRGLLFYSFLGIPFAKPPVGSLRFKDPELISRWEGVRDGSVAPPVCSQIDINSFILSPKASYSGEEDCLYLNIYTPEPNFEYADLPVLVYFHGGHFVSGGASDYEPHDIMNAPVLLVVVQYRLGVLGFMSTEDDVMPGNLGLKDQTMALKWIHHSIEHFGGSPLKITLFGSEAGAASIHYQTLSHHTIGLFQRAIMQSGNALCPWAQGGVHKEAAYHIGKHFKCLPKDEEETEGENGEEGEEINNETENKKNTSANAETDSTKNVGTNTEEAKEKEETSKFATKSDKEESKTGSEEESETEELDPEVERKKEEEKLKNENLLKCLQEVDVKELTNTAKLFYMWSHLPVIFGPRIDNKYLPDSPEFLLQMGRHKRLDLIIGINKDDGGFLTNSVFINEGRRMALKHHFPLIGPISLEFSDDDLAPLNMSIKAYDRYSGGIKANKEEAYNMTKLYTDRHYGVCSDIAADYHSLNNVRYKRNVYFYENNHRGQRSNLDKFNLNFGQEWVSEGDELFSLFPFNSTKDIKMNEEDEAMKETMIKMWYFFADTGNPTPNGTFEFTWDPYTQDDRRHLKLTTEPSMEDDNRVEAREFWTSLPTRQNMFLYKDYFMKILNENSALEEEGEEGEGREGEGREENKEGKNKTMESKDEL